MSRPLLLACTEVYPGPWVPTSGLKGIVRAEGLIPELDEVVLRIRDITEEDTVVTIDRDMAFQIDLSGAMARAERTKSSGSEVFIWLS